MDVPTAAHRRSTPARPVRRGRPPAGHGVRRGDHHPLVGPGDSRSAAAARAAPPSAGSSMAMTGSSTTVAPRPSRRSTSSEAWARARVTTTVRPSSGERGSRRAPARPPVEPRSRPATAPTTMAAGAGRSTSARSARVERTTCCASVVPQWTTATGVAAARPAASSPSVIRARSPMPMRTTSVPPVRPARPSRRRRGRGRRRGRSPRSPRWPGPGGSPGCRRRPVPRTPS